MKHSEVVVPVTAFLFAGITTLFYLKQRDDTLKQKQAR